MREGTPTIVRAVRPERSRGTSPSEAEARDGSIPDIARRCVSTTLDTNGSADRGRHAIIVARARSCLGARFRPHGRSIAHGLDCVGVAGIAFGRTVPGDYPLRSGDPVRAGAMIAAAGLHPTEPAATAAGDLVMLAGGPGQLHLAVLTPGGFVHADAGLRRVVETPGRPAAAILGAWRADPAEGRE